MFNKSPLWQSLLSRFSKEDQVCPIDEPDNAHPHKADLYVVSELDRSFYIQPQNEKELWRAKSFSVKEPETNTWLRSEIDNDSVFWDIGANIGLFSMYAATLNRNCRILAIEPESQNFASLCRNVFANGFHNIDVLGLAVYGGPLSIQELHVSEMCAGGAVHNLGTTSPWSLNQAVFQQKTFAASADELVKTFGFPAPSIMKIDVDGIELEILRGSSTILSESVQTVLVELDAHDDDDVRAMFAIMSNTGFSLIAESNRSTQINKKLPRNYIWKKI
ncbi:FkbM family methyltransferase [Methylocaldum sp.]|uniref:FkbM family methyltransferase n=1 Tax=Methylocaldum sp. TaxID=1969727 RepID=UPI0032200A14